MYQSSDEVFILFELVQGGDLKAITDGVSLNDVTAQFYIMQVTNPNNVTAQFYMMHAVPPAHTGLAARRYPHNECSHPNVSLHSSPSSSSICTRSVLCTAT